MPKENKSSGPAAALPGSVEASYRQKCIDLKKRIREIEDSNEVLVLRIQRSKRGIQRARLERAFLLQQLEDRTDARVEDSEGSPSPPPTPKEKPLRVKRPRKDAGPESPSRQQSPSPSREARDTRDTRENYPLSSYTTTFTSVNPLEDQKQPAMTISAPASTKKSARAPRGPKRPPNAYMIFCDKERENIRIRTGNEDEVDMPKALAKAWRDLGTQGQKPYFAEYDRNKEKYNEEVAAGKIGAAQSKRVPRAPSAASSATPYEGATSQPGSDHEEDDSRMSGGGGAAGGSAGGFTAVNR